MKTERVVYWAFLKAYHQDHMNAATHCSRVRYSALTMSLAEELENIGVVGGEVQDVLDFIKLAADDVGE